MTKRRIDSKKRTRIKSFDAHDSRDRPDYLATEEPLEIRLAAGGDTRAVSITMRTPGADFELAVGFLHGEGILTSRDDICDVRYSRGPKLKAAQQCNVVEVALTAPELPALGGLDRHFFATSACGVCGKTSLEALQARANHPVANGPEIDARVLYALPERLRREQGVFESTGGLHAAGLFTAQGDLLCLREDVGRHNAVDKVVGWALLENRLPLSEELLFVSGRSSWEIMQKGLVAGVPIVCAVSAPSSLAVDVAQTFGITLVGFLREQRFNVYSGAQRIRPAMAPQDAAEK